MITRYTSYVRRIGWCLAIMLADIGSASAAEYVSWHRAESDAVKVLAKPGASLVGLVQELERVQPVNGQEALYQYSVYSRASMPKQATQALQKLKQFRPDFGRHDFWQLYEMETGRRQGWDIAQAALEIFAGNVVVSRSAHSGWQDLSKLLEHMLKSGQTPEQIDAWFVARGKGLADCWVKCRIKFNLEHQRGPELVQDLWARARANPQDLTYVFALLDTLSSKPDQAPSKADLDWFTQNVKPQRATDASRLGDYLFKLKSPERAADFYRQAMSIPWTKDEHCTWDEESSPRQAIGIPLGRHAEIIFTVLLSERLAKCLEQTGQPDQAKELLRKAAEIRRENALRAQEAAMNDRDNSAHAPEDELRREEPKYPESDPRHWEQQMYEARRKRDVGREEAAIRQGFLACKPTPTIGGKGANAQREVFLERLVMLLHEQKRDDEAVELLRKELAESPAEAGSSAYAARALVVQYRKKYALEDAPFWTWLEKTPDWAEDRPKDVMEFLLMSLPPAEQDARLTRLEQLAFDGGPDRAFGLGVVEFRLKQSARAVKLLEFAAEKAPNKSYRRTVGYTLLQVYADLHDWKGAESLADSTALETDLPQVPNAYAQLALRALQAGDKADALRLWSRAANFDFNYMWSLDSLVKAGLRDELIAFYRDLAKQLPESSAPPRALAILQAK